MMRFGPLLMLLGAVAMIAFFPVSQPTQLGQTVDDVPSIPPPSTAPVSVETSQVPPDGVYEGRLNGGLEVLPLTSSSAEPTMVLTVPKGWNAVVDSSEPVHTSSYSLTNGFTTCIVNSRPGESGESLRAKVVVTSVWNGLPMTVRTERRVDIWITSVDYATDAGDVVEVRCPNKEDASLIASQIYNPDLEIDSSSTG